jgi:hypothetical protein
MEITNEEDNKYIDEARINEKEKIIASGGEEL